MTGPGEGSALPVTAVVTAVGPVTQLATCIEQAEAHLPPGSRIVVVPADGSPALSAWARERAGVELVEVPGPVGHAAAVNLGVARATTPLVLLLHDTTVVTPGLVDVLADALGSDPAVAAVGPVTNSVAGQQFTLAYASAEELVTVAGAHNHPDPTRRRRRLRLSDACLLVRRDDLVTAGPLDERLAAGALHDDDLSFRWIAAGRTLLLCGDAYAHSLGPLWPNRAPATVAADHDVFTGTWGFDPTYSTIERSEIVAMVGDHPADTPLRVLEVGCACGATLLEIGNRFPRAELYGIELNPGAAAIGSRVAEVRAMDAEQPLDYPEEFFDYVITADVLEHLVDPWTVAANLRPHLKPGGRILASIPNVMHVSVLRDLVNGRFTYQDAGILDRTHLRFFTLTEIDALFAGAGFGPRSYSATTVPLTDDDHRTIDGLARLSTIDGTQQFEVYQYLVSVER